MFRLGTLAPPLCFLLIPLSALAETSLISSPSVHARLRYEDIDADRPLSGANATVRLNVSNSMRFGRRLETLGELQAGYHVFNDLTLSDPAAGRELADINFLQINRLQAQYEFSPKFNLTLGRQYLSHSNERLLGSLRFLDNDQTFDAARLNYVGSTGTTFDVSYANRALRQGGRFDAETDFSGDIWNISFSTPTPLGTFFIHHQDIAFDDVGLRPASVANFETTLFSLSGRRHRSNVNVIWSVAYGLQDQDRAASASGLEYLDANASISVDNLTFTAGYEKLGAGSGDLAFQTPLGTNHAFQGKADLFLKTPPGGVIDKNANLSYAFGAIGEFKKVSSAIAYHEFTSDMGARSLGDEWDVTLQSVFRGALLKLEFANYQAASFGTDRTFVWLTVGKTY